VVRKNLDSKGMKFVSTRSNESKNSGINVIDSKCMKFVSTRGNESKNSVLHWNKLVVRNEQLL
jgi:hypothetical protein